MFKIFFRKSYRLLDKGGKNMADLNRPQMGIEYGAYATHAG